MRGHLKPQSHNLVSQTPQRKGQRGASLVLRTTQASDAPQCRHPYGPVHHTPAQLSQ
ncbi:hypothetical protein PanWU01x14_127630 [Parasponia andersonii]|uniref:Uncharacterized protein n=1 Tax=Parasponia andersonii TaxID=3476 RepID=A0A2P5CSP7_PARAD|nr:hypothetical protein PanWU01x14_127630 [Parasponia andersonii]